MLISKSLEKFSVRATLVMERLRVRILLYFNAAVMPLLKDMSTPMRGEKDSLMLTVETLYMEDGMGLPVVTSLMNPQSFIYSMKLE